MACRLLASLSALLSALSAVCLTGIINRVKDRRKLLQSKPSSLHMHASLNGSLNRRHCPCLRHSPAGIRSLMHAPLDGAVHASPAQCSRRTHWRSACVTGPVLQAHTLAQCMRHWPSAPGAHTGAVQASLAQCSRRTHWRSAGVTGPVLKARTLAQCSKHSLAQHTGHTPAKYTKP